MIKWEETTEKFQHMVKWAGLPVPTYYTHRIETFKPNKGNAGALKSVLQYINSPEHHFLALAGEVGRGKTHLAFGIAYCYIEKERIVKYWRVSNLLETMRNWYRQERQVGKSPIEWAMEVDLLILDDLGGEKKSEWADERLEDVIDHRYLNHKDTVFTTNMSLTQLTPRIASRIKEGVLVLLEGVDYREEIARKRGLRT